MLYRAASLKGDGFEAKPIVVCAECLDKAHADPNVEVSEENSTMRTSGTVNYCHYRS